MIYPLSTVKRRDRGLNGTMDIHCFIKRVRYDYKWKSVVIEFMSTD